MCVMNRLGTTQNHVTFWKRVLQTGRSLMEGLHPPFSYPHQHRINFPNMSRIHLSAMSHIHLLGETIPGQLRSAPPAGSGAGGQHAPGMVTKNQLSPLFHSTSSPNPSLVFSQPVVNCSSSDMAAKPVTCQPPKSMVSAAGEMWSCKNLCAFQRNTLKHRRLKPHDG